jgi:hypothetical protein
MYFLREFHDYHVWAISQLVDNCLKQPATAMDEYWAAVHERA